jgi:hypothetical protein
MHAKAANGYAGPFPEGEEVVSVLSYSVLFVLSAMLCSKSLPPHSANPSPHPVTTKGSGDCEFGGSIQALSLDGGISQSLGAGDVRSMHACMHAIANTCQSCS